MRLARTPLPDPQVKCLPTGVPRAMSRPYPIHFLQTPTETVMVMEAMKMEILIMAPAAGTIKEIKVAAGEMVESDAVVALID